MAIISARQVLSYLQPRQSIQVVESDGKDAFLADHHRILELVTKSQVCGRVRGNKLRYFELIVPIADATSSMRASERPGSGAVAQDSRTVHSGDDILALNYSHNFRACATYSPVARVLSLASFREELAKLPFDLVKTSLILGEGIS